MFAAMSHSPTRLDFKPFAPAQRPLSWLPAVEPVLSHSLPFASLSAYELVQHQYADQGIGFEGAIALLPSNSSFYEQSPQIVLMPTSQRRSIVITLLRPLQRVALRLRSYRDIRLSALDASGHCLAHCKTLRHRYAEDQRKAPLEELVFEGRNVHSLVVESLAPFTLESFSF